MIRFVLVPLLASSLHQAVIPDRDSTTLSEIDYLRKVHAKMIAMSGGSLVALYCPAEVSECDMMM